MKKNYTSFLLFALSCFLFSGLSAQVTYSVNSTNVSGLGGTCFSSTGGIDDTYECAYDDDLTPTSLGSFTDTSAVGLELSTMTLVVYGACSGDVEFFLNDTSLVAGTASGLVCDCQTIASDPGIPQTYTVTVTPGIIDAYVIGGENVIAAKTSNSGVDAQCFYGYDVIIETMVSSLDELARSPYKVYPNPANEVVYVSGLKQAQAYVVYDLLGAVLASGILNDNGSIAVRDFPEGMYVLQFENGHTVKFLKQ